MREGLQLVKIVDETGKAGILRPGDVDIPPSAVAPILEELERRRSPADEEESEPVESLGDLDQLVEIVPNLIAPYKRVVLAASFIHSRKRHKHQEWTSREHLEECLRQHRAYFHRRGVATSLDMDPKVAFGDKGVTGTANDRDVFVAFMKRIGLEDAVSPNAVAAAVMKGLREHPIMRGQPEDVYAKLFDAMSKRPGQNIERAQFDKAIAGTDLVENGSAAYDVLCELTRKRYEAINDAITRAHKMLQVSLTLEKEGIARFALNNPFGLAIPYEGSLFRVYELDEAQRVSRVCPTFFTITGGADDEAEFQVYAVSHGGFNDLDGLEKFRIGEVYVPATLEQLAHVGQFAVEHCQFDVAVLTESDKAIGDVLEGSGGAIRRMTSTFDAARLGDPTAGGDPPHTRRYRRTSRGDL